MEDNIHTMLERFRKKCPHSDENLVYGEHSIIPFHGSTMKLMCNRCGTVLVSPSSYSPERMSKIVNTQTGEERNAFELKEVEIKGKKFWVTFGDGVRVKDKKRFLDSYIDFAVEFSEKRKPRKR
jgi:ribosomal protein S27E